MRDHVLINAMEMHDKAINHLRSEVAAMQKILDRTYVQGLTHVMMWDALFTILHERNVFTKEQFDAVLKDLHDKTKAAMEAEQKTSGAG